MARYAMQCWGWMLPSPCPIAGQYLQKFELEKPGTEQLTWWTPDPTKAQVFPDVAGVINAWQTVRQFDGGLREDGRPDRPLTAFSITAANLDPVA